MRQKTSSLIMRGSAYIQPMRQNFRYNTAYLSSSVDEAAQRNYRQRALGALPFIQHMIGGNTPEAQQLLCHIDSGASAKEGVKDYFGRPVWATNPFLERVGQTSPESIKQLGEALAYGLGEGAAFDTAMYGERINKLPLFVENPDKARAVWWTVAVLHTRYSKPVAARMIINIGSAWEKNAIPTTGGYSEYDYMKALTGDLLLPAYIHAYSKHNAPITEDDMLPSWLEDQKEALLKIAEERLLVAETPKGLTDCTRRWEYNALMVEARKPLLMEHMQQTGKLWKKGWHALIEDQVREGYQFKILTSQHELTTEGKEMGHCVGGFRNVCESGDSHVVSGKSPKGERFTVSIERCEGRWVAKQIIGKRQIGSEKQIGKNKHPVSEVAKKAVWRLMDAMNRGEIEVNSKRGALGSETSLTGQMGFDPYNNQVREGIFQAYKEMRLLQKPWQKCSSLDNFLETSGIAQDILQMTQPQPLSPSYGWRDFVSSLFGKGERLR